MRERGGVIIDEQDGRSGSGACRRQLSNGNGEIQKPTGCESFQEDHPP